VDRTRGSGGGAGGVGFAWWVDDCSPVELIWRNARVPAGVVTRADSMLAEEIWKIGGLAVTSPERTAFDVGRRGRLHKAVVHLDALARATDFKVPGVEELVALHRHARGLRQLEKALHLMGTSWMPVHNHRRKRGCGSC
jgi:hypothetical protein